MSFAMISTNDASFSSWLQRWINFNQFRVELCKDHPIMKSWKLNRKPQNITPACKSQRFIATPEQIIQIKMRKHFGSVFAQEFSSTIPRNNQQTTEKMTNRSSLKSAYEHFSTTLPTFPAISSEYGVATFGWTCHCCCSTSSAASEKGGQAWANSFINNLWLAAGWLAAAFQAGTNSSFYGGLLFLEF